MRRVTVRAKADIVLSILLHDDEAHPGLESGASEEFARLLRRLLEDELSDAHTLHVETEASVLVLDEVSQ